MAERLNLHIDETGNQDLSEGRYLVAVVLHDHSADIEDAIARYRSRLSGAGLPDVPFHGKDLLHGNEGYANVSPGDRKRLLTQFSRFVRELPISFFALRYDGATVHNRSELEARLRRDLALLIFDSLSYFQAFDAIAVYYDNGQGAVSAALHDALILCSRRTLRTIGTPILMPAGFSKWRTTYARFCAFPRTMMLVGNRRPMSGFSAIAGISLSRLKSSSIERRLRRSPVDTVAADRLEIPRRCWRANETDRVANSGARAL